MKKWMTAMLTALLFFTVFQNVNAYRLDGWKRIDLSSMGYQIGSNVDSTCRSTVSSGISMWENTPYLEPEISFRESSSYSWYFSCNDFGTTPHTQEMLLWHMKLDTG
ncbi:hypothetical protein [Paenibacillus sp. NPDC093718]|uniref:hypothetical protein n=1 Tax=Paenibacillus sp. NPDC093718 TaxID=3390601 RepID=UPI003D05E870